MKRIIYIIVCLTFAMNSIYAQELPNFVQHRLDTVQKEVRRSLMDFRVWDVRTDGSMTLPLGLGFFSQRSIFSYHETLLIDSLGLNLSVGLIYDDEMRNRIVQLMRNEFRDDELDTLVNRRMKFNILSHEREALEISQFDTMQIFISTVDYFYTELVNKNPEDTLLIMYDYIEKYKLRYDVFKFLKLDTTAVFKQAYNKIVERDREIDRERRLTDSYYDRLGLAELCGYIGDERFIEPLIEALDKPNNFQREKVLKALARMRVEPYYSDYVKKRTLTNEQIMDEKRRMDFSLNDFVYVLGTQEAFLELSKYLLSNRPFEIAIEDSFAHITPVSDYAVDLLRRFIRNKDLQEMLGTGYTRDYTPLLKPLYDWMQENYGKYEIRRIW